MSRVRQARAMRRTSSSCSGKIFLLVLQHAMMLISFQRGWSFLQRAGDEGEIEQEEVEGRAADQQQQARRQAPSAEQTRA